MATQIALVGAGAGQYCLNRSVSIPTPSPGFMLCVVKAVALNPADWKMVDFSAKAGSIGGNEFSGEVCEVGPSVTKFKKGDRVLAVMFGLNPVDPTTGAFCQFALATAGLACTFPETMPYEEAASLAVAISTVTTTLYQMLGLPVPPPSIVGKTMVKTGSESPTYAPVSGSATATCTIAIQFLKASGLSPVATCSPSTRDVLLALGAVETFDYHSPTCGMEIRNYTDNSLSHVLDCVTQASSMKMSYEAIGPAGGRYVALDPFPTCIQYSRREVQSDWLVGYTIFNKPVKLSGTYGRPGRAQDRVFAADMFALAERMLLDGRLKPHPIEVRAGGLETLVEGIEDLRKGRVRARKLVYLVM